MKGSIISEDQGKIITGLSFRPDRRSVLHREHGSDNAILSDTDTVDK